MLLAFGVGGVIGLFLVRFAEGLAGEGEGDAECWVVVGDLPAMWFETDAPTPLDALRLYCAIAEGRSMSPVGSWACRHRRASLS